MSAIGEYKIYTEAIWKIKKASHMERLLVPGVGVEPTCQ